MRRIVLIDDEDDIREVTALTLETMGDFEVFAADNGFDGLKIGRAVQPAVILLDVMMPEIDGPTTLLLLRGTPGTSTIPVIFMTAKVQASDRLRLSALGALGIISKPFNPLTLADEVNALLAAASAGAAPVVDGVRSNVDEESIELHTSAVSKIRGLS